MKRKVSIKIELIANKNGKHMVAETEPFGTVALNVRLTEMCTEVMNI